MRWLFFVFLRIPVWLVCYAHDFHVNLSAYDIHCTHNTYMYNVLQTKNNSTWQDERFQNRQLITTHVRVQ